MGSPQLSKKTIDSPFNGRFIMGNYDIFNKKGFKMAQAQSSKLWTKDFIIISQINFLLSNANSDFTFLFSAVFIGIGFGTILSNFLAIAIQASSPHRKGLATSTFFISLDFANGIGPYINGILIAYLSFR